MSATSNLDLYRRRSMAHPDLTGGPQDEQDQSTFHRPYIPTVDDLLAVRDEHHAIADANAAWFRDQHVERPEQTLYRPRTGRMEVYDRQPDAPGARMVSAYRVAQRAPANVVALKPRQRPRGAGRPRAQATRSSTRSGDSCDDEPGEPAAGPRWTFAQLSAAERGEVGAEPIGDGG